MLTKADWAAIKKENGEHLKNEFLEEAKKNKERLGVILCENQYSPKMLLALKEMAKEDVYPDGRFGDMDCSIWEMFRNY